MSKGIKKAALALCIFVFILSALPAPNLAAEPASQTVRVKLSTNNATAIAVSVKGEYLIKECGLLLPSGTLTLRSNFNGTISAVHSTYGELYSGDTISPLCARICSHPRAIFRSIRAAILAIFTPAPFQADIFSL